MSKPRLFFSHIPKETEIAQALQKLIKSKFEIDVFVSSDSGSLASGHFWPSDILDALNTCDIAIALLSPDSADKPWINFEAGYVRGRGKPVIPLCHSGMTPDSAPAPLTFHTGISATDKKRLKERIFDPIAIICKCKCPTINPTAFIKTVRRYEASQKNQAEQADFRTVFSDAMLGDRNAFDYLKRLSENTADPLSQKAEQAYEQVYDNFVKSYRPHLMPLQLPNTLAELRSEFAGQPWQKRCAYVMALGRFPVSNTVEKLDFLAEVIRVDPNLKVAGAAGESFITYSNIPHKQLRGITETTWQIRKLDFKDILTWWGVARPDYVRIFGEPTQNAHP